MHINKSPSGALSPYYYKGGYFHGIHYGDYLNDSDGLFEMISKEEEYILASREQRRIMIDLYRTNMKEEVIEHLLQHIRNIEPCIIKLAIATDNKSLKILKKRMKSSTLYLTGKLFFDPDMETGKTWLVSGKE